MTIASTARLVSRLRSIEDDLGTSVHRPASQALDSVSTALNEIQASLDEMKCMTLLSSEDGAEHTIVLELEQAAMCARRTIADAGPSRTQYMVSMIAHVHAAHGVLEITR